MIYTSYFANLRKLPEAIVPIAICGKSPAWYNGIQYKKLAPKYEFFIEWKMTKDNDYYIRCFNEQVLSRLEPETVIAELSALAKGRDFALICYEKPDDFCHRHLVAEWLNNAGYNVCEYLS